MFPSNGKNENSRDFSHGIFRISTEQFKRNLLNNFDCPGVAKRAFLCCGGIFVQFFNERTTITIKHLKFQGIIAFTDVTYGDLLTAKT
jgi:hypothetical protein